MSYGGFYLSDPIGNNEFSFNERENRKIYVPSLIRKEIHMDNFNLDFVKLGEIPSFIEIEDGVERVCYGLEHMYEIDLIIDAEKKKKIFLFDNHNHAFYFWCRSIISGHLKKGKSLLHVDQHKDTRFPSDFDVDISNIDDVVNYTNRVLNVGNFIQPAMNFGIFSELVIVDSKYGLDLDMPSDYILDLDLDFFSRDMDYIDLDFRIDRVKEYIQETDLITVATSPYFIEQERAIDMFERLLK